MLQKSTVCGSWGEETDAAAFGCAPGDIKINVPGMIKEADGKFYKVGDDGQPLTDKNEILSIILKIINILIVTLIRKY